MEKNGDPLWLTLSPSGWHSFITKLYKTSTIFYLKKRQCHWVYLMTNQPDKCDATKRKDRRSYPCHCTTGENKYTKYTFPKTKVGVVPETGLWEEFVFLSGKLARANHISPPPRAISRLPELLFPWRHGFGNNPAGKHVAWRCLKYLDQCQISWPYPPVPWSPTPKNQPPHHWQYHHRPCPGQISVHRAAAWSLSNLEVDLDRCETTPAGGWLPINLSSIQNRPDVNWLVVSTHLKNISQNGNLPQIGVKIKKKWNHHLVNLFYSPPQLWPLSVRGAEQNRETEGNRTEYRTEGRTKQRRT